MSAHPFDTAIALAHQGEDLWHGHTSAAYANMVGPFGGITAAQALNGVLGHPRRLGEPVAFTVNFAAALTDGPFQVQARPVRTNRSTQHWMVEMRQGEHTVATATAVTALRRQTWGATEMDMPKVPPPQDVPAPTRSGRVEWIKRYDMRFIAGSFPPPGMVPMATTAARNCGCATTRRDRWTSRRSRPWPMCSSRASGGAARP